MATRTRIRFKDLVFDDYDICRLRTKQGWRFVVLAPWVGNPLYGVIVDTDGKALDIEMNNPNLDPLEVEALMAHYEVTQEGNDESK